MKKYFKSLDIWFYIATFMFLFWFYAKINNSLKFEYGWIVEYSVLLSIVINILIYIKWEKIKINFDWILNIIYRKKLLELNYQYKQQFFYLDIHKEQYSDDYLDFSISNTKLFESYQISRVCTKYFNNQIHFCIELKRPGILIGRKGSNIEEIQKLMDCKIHIIESKDIWFNKQNNIF